MAQFSIQRVVAATQRQAARLFARKDAEPRKRREPMSLREEVFDTLKTVTLAVAITLVFRFFFFQPFNIPSSSMKPNLLVGDFVVVSKSSYGYSRASLIYPFTRLDMPGRLFAQDPQKGDVVVFKNQYDRNRDYIKRVIGEEGDVVHMINGTLYINKQVVKREEISGMPTDCVSSGSGQAKIYRETLPNGTSYLIQECNGNNGVWDNGGPYRVPKGHFFVMGDNRDNSSDSRTPKVNFVPRDALVGKAERLAFSVDGQKAKIWQIWKWPTAIRYGRLFDRIE